jgi:hypothetical protein
MALIEGTATLVVQSAPESRYNFIDGGSFVATPCKIARASVMVKPRTKRAKSEEWLCATK